MALFSKTYVRVGILFVNLWLLTWGQNQPQTLTTGIRNTTIVEGGNLNLMCVFTEPLSDGYNVMWKSNEAHDIGRCQDRYPCVKFHRFNITRINIVENGRSVFALEVHNVSSADSGSYECGLENRSTNPLKYSQKSLEHVSVVSNRDINTPSCKALVTHLETGMYLQCEWPSEYRQAVGRFVLDDGVDGVDNMTSLNNGTSSGIIGHSDIFAYSEFAARNPKCVMDMPGLIAERSCAFPPVQVIQSNAKNTTTKIVCSDAPPGKNVSWFVLGDGNLKSIDQYFQVKTNLHNQMLIISDETIQQYNGPVVICTSSAVTGNRHTIFSLTKVVVSETETNDRFKMPNSLSQDTVEFDSTSSTILRTTESPMNQPIFSPSTITGYIMPPSFVTFIYVSFVASMLSLILAALALFLTCRRKIPQKQDTERAEAKVAPMSSNINGDYATITPSNLKPAKDELRFFENGDDAGAPNPTMEFLRATSVIHDLPYGFKRRTPSENGRPKSGHRYLHVEALKQGVSDIRELPRSRSNTDDESTLNSRTSALSNSEYTHDACLYPLKRSSSEEEKKDESDNPLDTSIAEETTLGVTDDHIYFSLEQRASSEDNHADSTRSGNEDIHSSDPDQYSEYDNFRCNRIPSSPKEKADPVTNIYEKLDPLAQN